MKTQMQSHTRIAFQLTLFALVGFGLSGCHWISSNVESVATSTAGANLNSPGGSTSYCVGDKLTNSPFAGGSGVSGDPYIICTATQLNTIGSSASYSGNSFKLMADIDLSSYNATTFLNPGTLTGFTGNFDGNNKTLSNLTFLNPAGGTAAGFFRGIGAGGVVQNLIISNFIVRRNGGNIGLLSGTCANGTISNIQVVGGEVRAGGTTGTIGTVVGSSNNCTISQVTSSATTESTITALYLGGIVGLVMGTATLSSLTYTGTININQSDDLGGLIGSLQGGTLSSSTSNGTIATSATTHLGGAVGLMYGASTLNRVASYSSVTMAAATVGAGDGVGGLVGGADTVTATYGVINSYARGAVVNNDTSGYAGALIGRITTGGSPVITNSYASGAVTGTATKGGLIGFDNNGGVNRGVYTASFYDSDVNTMGAMGAGPTPGAVSGQSTANMQSTATFSGAGWSSAIWNLGTSSQYLKLLFE